MGIMLCEGPPMPKKPSKTVGKASEIILYINEQERGHKKITSPAHFDSEERLNSLPIGMWQQKAKFWAVFLPGLAQENLADLEPYDFEKLKITLHILTVK